MTIFGRIWTAGIAYIALAVGAGLSIMYNVLQTIDTRGALLAWPDIVTAVSIPGLVVLMVELFVSRLWIGLSWYMQVLRTTGCAVIGGVAMRASWTHGHDWMLSHGHDRDVAVLWPLAIDLLAILATGLLLASRRRGHEVARAADMASGHVAAPDMANGQWTGPVATEDDVAISEAAFRGQPDIVASGQNLDMATDADGQPDNALAKILANANWSSDLDDFDRKIDMAIGQTGQELATETERYLASVSAPLPQRRPPVTPGIPEEALELLAVWLTSEGFAVYSGPAVDQLLAGWFNRTTRTARRWRCTVQNKPISGPPAQGGEE